jgi:hypothetical protein
MTTKPGPHIAKDANPNQIRRRDLCAKAKLKSVTESSDYTGIGSNIPEFSRFGIFSSSVATGNLRIF